MFSERFRKSFYFDRTCNCIILSFWKLLHFLFQTIRTKTILFYGMMKPSMKFHLINCFKYVILAVSRRKNIILNFIHCNWFLFAFMLARIIRVFETSRSISFCSNVYTPETWSHLKNITFSIRQFLLNWQCRQSTKRINNNANNRTLNFRNRADFMRYKKELCSVFSVSKIFICKIQTNKITMKNKFMYQMKLNSQFRKGKTVCSVLFVRRWQFFFCFFRQCLRYNWA